jgi:biotin/methionine sulfoxide reductase
LINTSFSLQRAEFGEQVIWCSIALAALIGQIGLPGGGVAHGLGAFNAVGQSPAGARFPSLPQGKNPVTGFIPAATFAEMLLRPGETFAYNGGSYTYPDIRLVYWAGGNPFHHHQDLNVLREALRWPEAIVVHESSWTATAKHADIVLPATTTLERNDIGTAQGETGAVAMKRVIDPVGEALDDYTIFTRLARRLHCETAFTEGRTADEWIRHLYSQWAARCEGVPDFDEFWSRGYAALPAEPAAEPSLRRFRAAPRTHPLPTPSGRIEVYSRVIASFGYADCPGHPSWIEPTQWGGAKLARLYPLSLMANQPAGRLHSQLDYGAASEESKVGGLEPLRMNPRDASARGLAGGERVLVVSARGRCLAGLVVDSALMRGVVQMSTGAWFSGTERTGAQMLALGNPNVLTAGATTSRLAQGCAGHMALVDVVREPTH